MAQATHALWQAGRSPLEVRTKMTTFNLPNLPAGWAWEPLPALTPNESNIYTIAVKAVNGMPGNQYVTEVLQIDLSRDSAADILNLFQAVCDKICTRIIEVQAKPVQRNIDLLHSIYEVFNGTTLNISVKDGGMDNGQEDS